MPGWSLEVLSGCGDCWMSTSHLAMVEKEIEMVALEEARRLFDYDPASGSIKWRVSLKTARAGDAAGSGNGDGYRQVSVGGKRYMTHRMAWFLYYGGRPAGAGL